MLEVDSKQLFSSGCPYLSFGTRKMKFRTYLHLTLISKLFLLSRLSDFVVCSNLQVFYIWSSGVYIEGSEHNVKLEFTM